MAIIATVLLELCLYSKWLWPYRKLSVPLVAAFVSVFCASLVMSLAPVVGGLFVLTTFGRLINLFRIVADRGVPDHLLRRTRRTGFMFAGIQLLCVGYIWMDLDVLDSYVMILALVFVQCIAAAITLGVTLRNLHKSHFIPDQSFIPDRDLPSISVCIPARNETFSLDECLRSVLASDYPKLEVIVLDDNSHDNTPEIIKHFAHDGVRFVQGTPPDNHWLAKNLAYERLAKEASGEIIVYCGVDIRFSPESLRRIVTALLTKRKHMLSIMPQRYTDSFAGAFIQPMRYWWELALPRKLFDRPPVLSSCWVIARKELHKLGGFASVSHAVIPEAYFARELIKTGAYSFVRSDAYLGIQTHKSTAEQRQTTIRVRYPQIHRRLELAVLLGVVEGLLLLGPFFLFAYATISGQSMIAEISAVTIVLLIATHVSIIAISSPPSVPIGLINFPIAILMELYLSAVSVFKYEFATVIWKGRVISPRRLEVIPKLPEL